MIECVRFKSCPRDSFLGFADFYIDKWGVELQGCSLYQKNGNRWLNLPSKEYTNEQGERKFAPYVRFKEKEHYKQFCQAAIKAIETYCMRESIALHDTPRQEAGFGEVPF